MNRRSFHRAPEGERRQELIEATLDCISEFGLKGATVRQIAIRAGVTAGLVRHYFESKDQMVAEAYRAVIASLTDKASKVEGDPEIYGGAADLVRSDAVLRLSISKVAPAGLIAFGTRHPGYFHAGQGTELMSFLGRVIEFGIRSWLDLPKP